MTMPAAVCEPGSVTSSDSDRGRAFWASFAKPKSRILMRPSLVTKIFSGFRSRWTIPFSCAAANPCAIWTPYRSSCAAGSAPRSSNARSSRLPEVRRRGRARRCAARCQKRQEYWDGSARPRRALPARSGAAGRVRGQKDSGRIFSATSRSRRVCWRDTLRPCRPRRAETEFRRGRVSCPR